MGAWWLLCLCPQDRNTEWVLRGYSWPGPGLRIGPQSCSSSSTSALSSPAVGHPIQVCILAPTLTLPQPTCPSVSRCLVLSSINISGASLLSTLGLSHLSPCSPIPGWGLAHSSPGPRPGLLTTGSTGAEGMARAGLGVSYLSKILPWLQSPGPWQEALRGQGPLARPTRSSCSVLQTDPAALKAPLRMPVCLSVSTNNSFTEIQFTYCPSLPN